MYPSSAHKKSEPCKGEIHFFRHGNPLPCARNFKPEFEFQTSLAQISPVGTLELLPFGTNLDINWDWIFPEIPLKDYSLFSPVNHKKDKIAYVSLDTVADYIYIV